MQFANPWAFALLLLVIPLVVVERLSRRSLSGPRRWATLALRLLVLGSIVTALADPRVTHSVDRLAVAYLIDGSASVPTDQRDKALEWVRQAIASKRPDDQAAVIVFGADPLVERAPSTASDLPSLSSEPDASATDVSAALRLALGLLPTDAGRKIVVLTDGNETKGKALNEARLLAAAGVGVSVVPLNSGTSAEVLVRSVDAPSLVRQGEALRVRVTVDSTGETTGRLHLMIDDRVVTTQAVTIHPGPNTFTLPQDPLPPGFHTIQAHLDSLQSGTDSLPENNDGMSFVVVNGQANVLVVEGTPGEGKYLSDALKAGGLTVAGMPPSELPSDPLAYRAYDGVVLVNVPANKLTAKQMTALRDSVQRFGTGLTVVGGDQSFGAGAYSRTPLADALPVDMQRRGVQAQSAAALLLVIDTSGSMGESINGTTKMALARESAQQAIDLLNAQDVVGVLAFEDTNSWILPLNPLTDPAAAKAAVSRLQPGGGTAIYPALLEAERAMTGVNAKVRHIVLLTDGISPPGDYAGLTQRLRQNNITLSTIAVGSDADQMLLRTLAESGAGTFYDASDPTDLPQFIIKETVEVARAAITEQTFRPAVVSANPILEGIPPETLPALRGYIATTPKQTAQVTLVSPQQDPILAEWQYGLGRTVVWTSDAENRWAANWIEWPQAVAFWTKLVKHSFASPMDQSFQTQVNVQDGTAHVVVDAVGDNRAAPALQNFLPLKLQASAPDGKSTAAALTQVAPGRYATDVPATAPGAYLLQVSESDQTGKLVGLQTVGFSVDYSPEYRQTTTNLDLLGQLAQATGGQILTDPAESFRHDIQAQGGDAIWQWFVVLAALLFLGDVGARRLRVSLDAWRRAVGTATVAARRFRPARPVSVGARALAARRREPATALPQALVQRRQEIARRRPSAGTPNGVASPASVAARPAAPPRPAVRPAAPARSTAPPVRPTGGRELGARLMQAKQRGGRPR